MVISQRQNARTTGFCACNCVVIRKIGRKNKEEEIAYQLLKPM
jgi:hypothetical protein